MDEGKTGPDGGEPTAGPPGFGPKAGGGRLDEPQRQAVERALRRHLGPRKTDEVLAILDEMSAADDDG